MKWTAGEKMKNNKLKRAGFNLALQNVIKDNWRFLASICVILAKEYGWGEKRLNGWVERAAEYCNKFNDFDKDGIYDFKLTQLEKRHGSIITRGRVENIVFKNTTLRAPGQIKEIVDNLLLQLLMTVEEFPKVGRERLIAGLEAMGRANFDAAPELLKEKYGVRLDTSFQDYHSLIKERRKAEKASWEERQRAGEALQAFRKWTAENCPKGE